MKLKIQLKQISNIPVLEVFPEITEDRKLPIVLVLHGFLSRKEEMLTKAFWLAKSSFFVVLLDSYEHGDLESVGFKELSYFEKGSKLFTIIDVTTNYIDAVIEAYTNHPIASNQQVGLLGFSMGGMIVYNYITKLLKNNIKAAVSILATPVWDNPLKRDMQNIPEFARYISENDVLKVERIQPSNFRMNLHDFPLLMINTEKDEKMPIEDVRDFYSYLKQQYSNKELIKLHEYSEIEHTDTSEMIQEAVVWLKRFLLP